MTQFKKLLFFISLLLLISSCIASEPSNAQTTYQFIDEPIDVVIPAVEKDQIMLQYCIEGIKRNCKNIRRVIVVSPIRLTNDAEWFNENDYPFSIADVALYLNKLDLNQTAMYLSDSRKRVGWYFQQLLKLYASYVIPGISSNVLVLDSDTVFFRMIDFINEEGGANFALGTEYHIPYFEHMQRLLPWLGRVYHDWSGISHHTLIQRPILDDLFNQVESYHQKEFWKAYCLCVDPAHLYLSGSAENEVYFNFAVRKTSQVNIRGLLWTNSGDLHFMQQHKDAGYDFVSYHAYMRG